VGGTFTMFFWNPGWKGVVRHAGPASPAWAGWGLIFGSGKEIGEPPENPR